MDPKVSSLTCANGVTWSADTEAADAVLQLKDRSQLVKSRTLSNGPPRATNAG
jgi:hypothetical protein